MKRRILPRITGTERDKLYPRVEREIDEQVEHLARMHNCSKSFVVNTILADAFGIGVKERYYDERKVTR